LPERNVRVAEVARMEKVLGREILSGKEEVPRATRRAWLKRARKAKWELQLPRPRFPVSAGSANVPDRPAKTGFPTSRDPVTGEKVLVRWSGWDRWRAPAHGKRRTVAWRKLFQLSGGTARQMERRARRRLERGDPGERERKRQEALAEGKRDPFVHGAQREVERDAAVGPKLAEVRAGPHAKRLTPPQRRQMADATRALMSSTGAGAQGTAEEFLRPFREWRDEGKWPEKFVPPRGGWAAAPGKSRFSDPLNDVDQWLNVGAQWGPRTPAPGWAGYMLGRRGMAILDLDQTLAHLRRAGNVVRDTINAGGHVLLLNPRPHLEVLVEHAAQLWGVSYVHGPLPPGLWTNWTQVGLSLERYRLVKETLRDGVTELEQGGKVGVRFRKLGKLWKGIKETCPPDLVVSMDVAMTHPTTRECWHRGIPVVGFGDGGLAGARSRMGTMVPYPVPLNVENELAVHAALNYMNPKYDPFKPYRFGLRARWEQRQSVAQIRGETYRPRSALARDRGTDHILGHADKDAWKKGLPVDDLRSDGTRKLTDQRGTMGNLEHDPQERRT